MEVVIKIFGCYELTYKPHCLKIAKLLYGDSYKSHNFRIEIVDISERGTLKIQQQRSIERYVTRTVSFFENGVLKHIVGMSNTCYDEDRHAEFLDGNSNKTKDSYGINNYHANTFMKQGINKIIGYFFENIGTADLSFYVLDIHASHPHNVYNVLSYRELETLGFKILNADEIDYQEYNTKCHRGVGPNNLKLTSFERYINDIARTSNSNTGNSPSFLQCNESIRINSRGETESVEEYTFIFKSLSAQAYDSLIRMWCLHKLAKAENIPLKFILGRQYFAYTEAIPKIADRLTGPVKEILDLQGINVEILTNDEFMKLSDKADDIYTRYKKKRELRNQALFRNNMLKKGMPIECAICGNENMAILDAAHIWEVNSITNASVSVIQNFIKLNELEDILVQNSKYKDEVFYKRYCLTNSGDNGIWLCKNHHKLFDGNYFIFDSDNGKIVLKFKNPVEAENFQKSIDRKALKKSILTKPTKAFLAQRILSL